MLAPRLGPRRAKWAATLMLDRPDYYAGRVGVGMSIKDELGKDSYGDPPKHGDLNFTLLHHSLEMHALCESAIDRHLMQQQMTSSCRHLNDTLGCGQNQKNQKKMRGELFCVALMVITRIMLFSEAKL
jgi:hypothetical protein